MQRKFIFDGGASTRYHTVDMHYRQTIADHSFGVAWFCELITEGRAPKELIMAALTHDLAEHIVGDIPSPAKRSLGVGKMWDDFETKHLDEAGIAGYAWSLHPEEQVILKLADMLDGMMFCLRERKMGNHNVEVIFDNFRKYTREFLEKNPALPESTEAYRLMDDIVQEWEELTNERNVKRECKAGSGNALSIEISTLGLGGDDKSAVSSGGSDEVSDTVEEKERNTGS